MMLKQRRSRFTLFKISNPCLVGVEGVGDATKKLVADS